MSRGFLVVLAHPEARNQISANLNPHYSGVARVPSYMPGEWPAGAEEQQVMFEYVCGNVKDQLSNLIPTYPLALSLWKRFEAASTRGYGIVSCTDEPDESSVRELIPSYLQQTILGYDIADVTGPYLSHLDEFPASAWATPFRRGLNSFGLFSRRAEAISFLEEFRKHKEPGYDAPCQVVHLVEIQPGTGQDC